MLERCLTDMSFLITKLFGPFQRFTQELIKWFWVLWQIIWEVVLELILWWSMVCSFFWLWFFSTLIVWPFELVLINGVNHSIGLFLFVRSLMSDWIEGRVRAFLSYSAVVRFGLVWIVIHDLKERFDGTLIFGIYKLRKYMNDK